MPPQLPKPLSPAVGQGRNSAWPNAHTLPLFLGLWPPALAIAKNAELLMNPRLKYSRGSAAVIAFVNIFFFPAVLLARLLVLVCALGFLS